MTILPMMRGGAVAIVLATATLVQGCSSPGTAPPTKQALLLTDTGPTTGVYSGAAWYADLYHVMTTNQGGE